MAEAIKAIETEYRGYKFRSRLEARYGVFFDAMGIKWEYEKEGFELGNGVRYLPDFWLPAFAKSDGVWAEVKPGPFSHDETERCQRLVDGTHHGCLLLVGVPGETHLSAIVPGLGECVIRWQNYGPFDRAVVAAKQARFEFGEKGGRGKRTRKSKATITPHVARITPPLPEEVRTVAPTAVKVIPKECLDWEAVLTEVGKASRTVAMYVGPATPVSYGDGRLLLAFPWLFHKERIEDPKNRGIVERALAVVLGVPCSVDCALMALRG